MLRRCRMDLHIHSALSPCAEVEMLPELIVMKAEMQGLDVIAVCDHNSAENAAACVEASRGSPVRVLPGIECETREGVHVLGIFDRPEQAAQLQEFVWSRLPDEPNRPEFFGQQLVVTADGEFVRYNPRLLATSADAGLEEMCARIRDLGGLALPSHVDKTFAGLIGVLGLIPEGLELEGVEISAALTPGEARARYPQLAGLGLVRSSDAHRLSEIGQVWTAAWLEKRTVEEIRLALCGRNGRRLEE
ncbi:MAG: hypothetical protein WHZ52_01465 [Armatimonadota bacterium]